MEPQWGAANGARRALLLGWLREPAARTARLMTSTDDVDRGTGTDWSARSRDQGESKLAPVTLNIIQNELNTSVAIPDTKEETKNLTESVPLEPLSINFSDKDMVVEGNGTEVTVEAPKDLDTLEKKAEIAQAKRKQEEAEEESLKIGDDISLDITPISLDITEL